MREIYTATSTLNETLPLVTIITTGMCYVADENHFRGYSNGSRIELLDELVGRVQYETIYKWYGLGSDRLVGKISVKKCGSTPHPIYISLCISFSRNTRTKRAYNCRQKCI